MSDTTNPGPATAVLPRVEIPDPAEVAGMSPPDPADLAAQDAYLAATPAGRECAYLLMGQPCSDGRHDHDAAILPGPPVPVPPPPPPVDAVDPDHSPGAAGVLPGVTCSIPGHCDPVPFALVPDHDGSLHRALIAAGVPDAESYTLATMDPVPPPAATPPESAADAPPAQTPPVPVIDPTSGVTVAPGPVRNPMRNLVRASVLTQWLVNACGPCGEWSSLAVSSATRNVVMTLPDEATFIRWCAHLNIAKARRQTFRDALGSYVQGTGTANGWTLTVHLPIPQEIPR